MTMKRNDDAVSPVIGVILMVAITVILAAVIAAFVFGLAGNVQGAKVVGLTVADNGEAGVVTWQGGADMNSITKVVYTLNGTNNSYNTLINGAPTVGEVSYTNKSNSFQAITSSRLMLVASFQDGSEQVIFDKQF